MMWLLQFSVVQKMTLVSGKGLGVWDFSYRSARSGDADLERELASVLGVFALSYLPKFCPLKKKNKTN